jgi:bifunctional DNA-binding transcriptional regulator/antitoxin component of YhaV-PrlF toxin-antitoxin module
MQQKEVRKLKKTGRYSYTLTIPKEMIEKYGWKEKQKIVITDKGRGVLEVRDWRKR